MRGVLMLQATLFASVLIAGAASAGDLKETPVSLRTAQTHYTRGVVSFHELRQAKLVRQSWDTSCGAAALSTLLTYHVGLPVSEYAVATMILRGSDPNRVRQRGGFSLLDLKRFVEAIGLAGEGFGSMSVADLDAHSSPAILPIRLRELDHFVVFRGVLGDRVLLGDPAFGNLTMPIAEFESVWRSRIAFYVHAKGSQNHSESKLEATALDLPIPDMTQVGRLVRGFGPIPPMRQLPLVARAK